jgi:hypothetical protein
MRANVARLLAPAPLQEADPYLVLSMLVGLHDQSGYLVCVYNVAQLAVFVKLQQYYKYLHINIGYQKHLEEGKGTGKMQ